jgi:hypothetical protein
MVPGRRLVIGHESLFTLNREDIYNAVLSAKKREEEKRKRASGKVFFVSDRYFPVITQPFPISL